MNATFRCPGPVATGMALMGRYQWSQGVVLAVSVVVASPGTADTVFALTVDGVESGYAITLAAGQSRALDTAPALGVRAQAVLGVLVKSAGTVEDNPADVSVTLDIAPAGQDGSEESSGDGLYTAPLMFRTAGPMYAGVVMQGQYVFSKATMLRFARCRCHPGSEACTITVFLGGVASTGSLTIPAGADSAQDTTLVLRVPANTPISARLTVSGTVEECAADGVLVLMVGDADAFPEMIVRYVSASETVALYAYDAETRVLSEASAGVTAGRGVIEESGGALTMGLGGDSVAVIDTSTMRIVALIETEHTAPSDVLPRFEFVIDGRVVASLAADGLRTPRYGEPTAFGWTGIELCVAGVPVAVIARAGVGAPECIEGEIA